MNGSEEGTWLRDCGPADRRDRLVSNLNVGDLRLGENMLAAYGRAPGVLTGENPGHHTHPKEKWTSFLFDPGVADGVGHQPPALAMFQTRTTATAQHMTIRVSLGYLDHAQRRLCIALKYRTPWTPRPSTNWLISSNSSLVRSIDPAAMFSRTRLLLLGGAVRSMRLVTLNNLR